MDSENNPHKRAEDKNIIFQVWNKIYPYWHIGATISGFLLALVFAVWWVRDVSAYAQTLDQQDRRITKLEVIYMDVAEMKGEVSAIRQFIGAPSPKPQAATGAKK